MSKKNSNKIDTSRFREKQMKAFIECGRDLNKMPTKENCSWKEVDGEILCFMVCVVCKVAKERTTENFVTANVTKGIEQWFTRSKAGCDNLSNSIHKPCITCYTEKTRQLHMTDEKAYFYNVSTIYSNISYDDIIKLWESTTHGHVTGIPKMYMRPFRHHDLAPGIHDLKREHWEKSEKYNQASHTIDTVCLDLAISNVAQIGKISDLRLAYVAIYNHEIEQRLSTTIQDEDIQECKRIEEWFKKTPKENGVTARKRHDQKEYQAQRRKLDLNYILGAMIGDNNKTDKQCGRDNVVPKKSVEYLNVLLEYKMRCAISGIRLTIKENKFTDLSFDRIDNNLSHMIDNIRPVCALFQVAGKKHMSRKQYLHMCLIQVHVTIPATILQQIQSDHDALNEHCAFCLLE